MVKKVVFRADGDSKIGLGHIYRCIAIADMLNENFTCEFLLNPNSQIKQVIPLKYSVIYLPSNVTNNDAEWIKYNYNSEDSIIILDGYQFTSNYQKQLKDNQLRFIYIDDLYRDYMFADAVINHSPLALVENYQKEDYTKLYLGLDYVLLRESFLNASKNPIVFNSKFTSALICLGGSDEHNVTLKILSALVKLDVFTEINVVVGVAYSYKDTLLDVINSSSKKINVHSNLNETEMLFMMQKNDIAFAPSSTTCLELIAVKKPLFVGFSADNQKGLYEYLINRNLVFDLKNLLNITSEEIFEIVSKNIYDLFAIENMLLAQQKLIDGDSGKRINNIINELI